MTYTAYDLNDFVAWIMVDDPDENDVRTVVIANPALTMSGLSKFFNEKYIVVSPTLQPKIGKQFEPWTLQLRRRNEDDLMAGPCTCETVWCHLREGNIHVSIHK